MNEGDNRRESLQFPNSPGRGQGQEKKHLLGEGTQRSTGKRFEGGGVQIPQNHGENPSRWSKLAVRRLKAKRPEQVTNHWMRRQGRKLKTENCRRHRVATLERGNAKVPRRTKPAKKISHLRRQGRPRHGVTVRVVPRPINLPLELIRIARGWST